MCAKAIQEYAAGPSHAWLKSLAAATGEVSELAAYRHIKAVLRAIRDILPDDAVLELGENLPTLLRVAFFEGWRPQGGGIRILSKNQFIGRLYFAFPYQTPDEIEEIVTSVFTLLDRKLPLKSLSFIKRRLPRGIRPMWPQLQARVICSVYEPCQLNYDTHTAL